MEQNTQDAQQESSQQFPKDLGTVGGGGQRGLLELGAHLPMLASFASSTKPMIISSFILGFLEVGRRESWICDIKKPPVWVNWDDVQAALGQPPLPSGSFFFLSTSCIPNTSHPIIPVEATFLHKAKCIWGSKTKEHYTKIFPFSTLKLEGSIRK